jgi:hypothetical protein
MFMYLHIGFWYKGRNIFVLFHKALKLFASHIKVLCMAKSLSTYILSFQKQALENMDVGIIIIYF